MVKRLNKTSVRNSNPNPKPLSRQKTVEFYEDDLIQSLSQKHENRRAIQTWQWELARRNSVNRQEIS